MLVVGHDYRHNPELNAYREKVAAENGWDLSEWILFPMTPTSARPRDLELSTPEMFARAAHKITKGYDWYSLADPPFTGVEKLKLSFQDFEIFLAKSGLHGKFLTQPVITFFDFPDGLAELDLLAFGLDVFPNNMYEQENGFDPSENNMSWVDVAIARNDGDLVRVMIENGLGDLPKYFEQAARKGKKCCVIVLFIYMLRTQPDVDERLAIVTDLQSRLTDVVVGSPLEQFIARMTEFCETKFWRSYEKEQQLLVMKHEFAAAFASLQDVYSDVQFRLVYANLLLNAADPHQLQRVQQLRREFGRYYKRTVDQDLTTDEIAEFTTQGKRLWEATNKEFMTTTNELSERLLEFYLNERDELIESDEKENPIAAFLESPLMTFLKGEMAGAYIEAHAAAVEKASDWNSAVDELHAIVKHFKDEKIVAHPNPPPNVLAEYGIVWNVQENFNRELLGVGQDDTLVAEVTRGTPKNPVRIIEKFVWKKMETRGYQSVTKEELIEEMFVKIGEMKDLTRGILLFNSMDKLVEVVKELVTEGESVVNELKVGFLRTDEVNPGIWQDIKVIISLPAFTPFEGMESGMDDWDRSGGYRMLSEIQFVLKEFYDARKKGGGHKTYSMVRGAEAMVDSFRVETA